MDLDDLRRNWEALGDDDPMWAILSDPSRRGGRWTPEEFLATGEQHVTDFLADLDHHGGLPGKDRALDFGCGAGRLTQALAGHFARVDGVDIADSMLEFARDMNQHPDTVHYHLNVRDDLSLFDDASFDLVLSVIVLQHVENRYKERYLREFLRVLRPGGAAFFTVPSHPRWTPGGMVYRLPNSLLNLYRRRRYGYRGVMELHGMARGDVVEVIARAGGVLVDVAPEPLAGGPWHSYRYIVRAPERSSGTSR